jgi:hypothetical protein
MAEGAKTGDESGTKQTKQSNQTKQTSRNDSINSARKAVATGIWVLAVIAALILAAGALVIALDFNTKNNLVHFFITTAHKINFVGDLKHFGHGKSASSKHDALVKTVLVNWGICAVIYLVVGKVLDRLIRP